ncbi:MAG TPA: hypothetical protein VK456_14795 [Xanthobacteraceae bacterium]|nr:hypothetical protein [Xanthobacteraceae bacterium]
MAVNKAKATAITHKIEQEHAANQVRTWTFTIAISATLLAIMYGLAFWHEARARATAAEAAQISAPAH